MELTKNLGEHFKNEELKIKLDEVGHVNILHLE